MRRRGTARPMMDDRGYDASTAITSGCTISIIRYIVRSNVWLAWWLCSSEVIIFAGLILTWNWLFSFISFVSLMKISDNFSFYPSLFKATWNYDSSYLVRNLNFKILISIRSSRLGPQDDGFQYCEMVEENWKDCMRRSHPLVVVRRRSLSSVERTRGWIRSRSFRV